MDISQRQICCPASSARSDRRLRGGEGGVLLNGDATEKLAAHTKRFFFFLQKSVFSMIHSACESVCCDSLWAGAEAAVTSEAVCVQAPSSDDNWFTICGTKSFSQSKAKRWESFWLSVKTLFTETTSKNTFPESYSQIIQCSLKAVQYLYINNGSNEAYDDEENYHLTAVLLNSMERFSFFQFNVCFSFCFSSTHIFTCSGWLLSTWFPVAAGGCSQWKSFDKAAVH